jgi:hypothetical protein
MVVFIFTPLRVVTCESAAPVPPVPASVRALALETKPSALPKVPSERERERERERSSKRKRKRDDDGKYSRTVIQRPGAGPPAKRVRASARTHKCKSVLRRIDQTTTAAEVSTHDLLFCDEGPLSASGSEEPTLGSEDYIHKLLYCDEGPLSVSASGFGSGPERAATFADVSLGGGGGGGGGGSAVSSLRQSLGMAEAEGIIGDLCRWDQRSSPDLGHWGNGLLDDLIALWHP